MLQAMQALSDMLCCMLADDMVAELKAKDDEYVRALKQQAEDVDMLLQYMGQQLEEMQNGYTYTICIKQGKENKIKIIRDSP